MRVTLLQLNPTVGACEANAERIMHAYSQAVAAGSELVVCSELALIGYPPRDLLHNPDFQRLVQGCNERVIQQVGACALVLGTAVYDATGAVHNAALWIEQGAVRARYAKQCLPSYDIYDDTRYFTAGSEPTVVHYRGRRFGLSICEDIWGNAAQQGHFAPPIYQSNPLEQWEACGIDVLLNLSASPYEHGKPQQRRQLLHALAQRLNASVLYCNQVGAQDSLIFDGASLCVDSKNNVQQGLSFREDIMQCTLGALQPDVQPAATASADVQFAAEEVYAALVLGIRDYARKCGFSQAVLGLSGGIDSAVTAALACAALGPEAVLGITMPSRFSSRGSEQDAHALAQALGMPCSTISVEPMFEAFLAQLEPAWPNAEWDTTEENLQARIRGALLMAHANKQHALLLATGNKSELALGYCTLYGDMCGALAPIADLYKTEVYTLAHYINQHMSPGAIPTSTLTKPPSAELRANQRDSDSLPAYELIDPILRAHIEQHATLDELAAQSSLARDEIRQWLCRMQRNEHKRCQAPPALRVSHQAFGVGRRLPLAERFKL